MALFYYLFLFKQHILQKNNFRSYLKRTTSERVTYKSKEQKPTSVSFSQDYLNLTPYSVFGVIKQISTWIKEAFAKERSNFVLMAEGRECKVFPRSGIIILKKK